MFPAGKYRALQITLGKGEGHNWWCVLYPNMCFQGSVYEVMDESSGEELREVLTQEEYADVFDLNVKLVSIEDFGGWDAVQAKHFADGGIFDQIYEK